MSIGPRLQPEGTSIVNNPTGGRPDLVAVVTLEVFGIRGGQRGEKDSRIPGTVKNMVELRSATVSSRLMRTRLD